MERQNIENQYQKLVALLKSERNSDGFWSGRLSSSALGTAVAVVALKIQDEPHNEPLVINGLKWLIINQNQDGGYGDTPDSLSNVSTSLLSFSAISYCKDLNVLSDNALQNIEKYLLSQDIDLSKDGVAPAVLKYYGKDLTFSVPILSMLIVCGVLDPKISHNIPQLPFEFSLLPSEWYSLVNLRVVSYALPALIGVGIFIFKTRKRHNPLMRWIRSKSIQPALNKLEKILPESGGFLEAIPLTAFVAMCLISCGYKDNPVAVKGLNFLINQQREDGSWPVDTDLSTWVTTLSIKAIGSRLKEEFQPAELDNFSNHLKSIQYKEIHPFNGSTPGGWGWTNYAGSVPDVDDTSGAILALLELSNPGKNANTIINGCKWLINLQNKDGGFPTFCRGWGRLPFDSSCADLTGHALLAMAKSLDQIGDLMATELKNGVSRSITMAFGFLWKNQDDDGSWNPLWFGNQLTRDKKNPVYGTAKVSIYLNDSLMCNCLDEIMKRNIGSMVSRGLTYLEKQQNNDGSWGGEYVIPGSIEETSLAVAALSVRNKEAGEKGLKWLDNEFITNGLTSKPIGLYFAMLWYDEKLYPLVYYVEALRRFLV